jgi:hypothetical protein
LLQFTPLLKFERVNSILRSLGCALLISYPFNSFSWDYEGHRIVNLLALRALGTNAPAFTSSPEGRERIAFLSGEPDRWRNTPDLPLKNAANPDHFFDVEGLEPYKMKPGDLPHFRYDFLRQCSVAHATAPANFPSIDPARDPDHTKWLAGFLPWTITEHYARLKSGFSYLKAYQDGGTPEEILNAQQNTIYLMGVMGHFVGDAAQPLHSTIHYNGWVGQNPKGYTVAKTFHAWIDGGYIQKLGLGVSDLEHGIRPAKLIWDDGAKHKDVFLESVAFIGEQHKLVETLYDLEKGKKLFNKEPGEGRDLIVQQLRRGAEFLTDLWLTAAKEAPPDDFLINQLSRRKRAR